MEPAIDVWHFGADGWQFGTVEYYLVGEGRMKPQGQRMRPPVSPAYKFGQVIVLEAEDDEIQLNLPPEGIGSEPKSSNSRTDVATDPAKASQSLEGLQTQP